MTAVAAAAANAAALGRRLATEQADLERAWRDSQGRAFSAEVFAGLANEARTAASHIQELDRTLEAALRAVGTPG